MPSTMKFTVIFQDGAAGWSEVFYLTPVDADPDKSRDAAHKLGILRAGMLPSPAPGMPPVRIQAIRVSNVANPNVAALFPATGDMLEASKENPPTMMGTRTPVLQAYANLKANRRTIALRGMPLPWMVEGGDLSTKRTAKQSAGLNKAIKAMKEFLTTKIGPASWALRVKAWVVPGRPTTITRVERDVSTGTELWKITVPITDPPLNVNDRIRIEGIHGRGVKGINGATTIYKILPDSKYLITKRPCSQCAIVVLGMGSISREGAVTYPNIHEVIHTGYSQRATGRAFFRRLGHRKAKKCKI